MSYFRMSHTTENKLFEKHDYYDYIITDYKFRDCFMMSFIVSNIFQVNMCRKLFFLYKKEIYRLTSFIKNLFRNTYIGSKTN